MINFKFLKKSPIVILGTSVLFSCSDFVSKKEESVNRYIASTESEQYLQTGLYPKSLVNQNIFDKEGRAKVVFNLPPYTNPGGIGIIPEMLNTIASAKRSIRMSVFQFNHIQVFNALKEAINRGVKVYVSTDLCYSSKVGYKEYFDDLRSYLSVHGQSGETQVIDDATNSCEGMFNHNKYMIVDVEDSTNAKAWFGSFNPTNHGSVENVELAILFKDPKAAAILKLDFDQQMAKRFKVNKDGVYSVIINNQETIKTLTEAELKKLVESGVRVTYPKVIEGDTEFEFILSPKVKSLTRIVEEVYNAKKEILFSSYAIADQMLISSLINKSKSTNNNYNLYSILALPHPGDSDGVTLIKNGDTKNLSIKLDKTPMSQAILKSVADEIKISIATPVNYLTPKGELKSIFHYIYQKGVAGGIINKVNVEGIFNNKVIEEKNTLQRLANNNIPVYKSSLTGELHNKLFLIDEQTVIFGSHNFSQSAENSNDELTVIIKSEKLTKLLKNELFNKTKLFSVKYKNPNPSFTSSATLVISEVMAESEHMKALNNKNINIGNYIEVYNFGDKPINLMGFRYDDHFFPENNNDQLDNSNAGGFQGTLVRFTPNKNLNQLGILDYNPANNILKPGQSALIVGKYFNEAFYLDNFKKVFKETYNKEPSSSDYPMLFSEGEYYSSNLGDAASGISSNDKISIFGIDGMTVIDRFNTPKAVSKSGLSIERTIDIDKLKSEKRSSSYSLQTKNYKLKNGTALQDTVFESQFDHASMSDWEESKAIGGTPGVVSTNLRKVASIPNLYTIEGEYADVESNTFKKAYIVIKDQKIYDIVSVNQNYPAPIMKDVLIFPGLIDTHNHIKYNTMPVWKTTKKYENRNQWPEDSIYKNGIKELYKKVYMEWPECNLGDEAQTNKCLAQNRCKILKYAEMKALIGGTTSLQGSSSFDENTSDITFKGLTGYTAGSGKNITKSKAKIAEELLDTCSRDFARNIERELWHGSDEVRTTAQSIFSDAFAHKSISDPVKFKQTPSFKLLEEFKNKITNTFFVHLSEGVDQSSLSEFAELSFLKLLAPQTTIIHGTALTDAEFSQMNKNNMSLAWSPTSNLLLYKKTTDIPTALKNNVNVSIGSDWSLSGTKSLLYELKVANKVNQKYFGNKISKNDLLKMVTINGAKASHLESLIGSISKNKYADFFIVKNSNKASTPLDTLLKIQESAIDAVFVGGLPVVGNIETLTNINLTPDHAMVKDESCYKNLAFSVSDQELDTIVSPLVLKTKNGFSSLNSKLQTGLGSEFSRLDPLCTENDVRMNSIMNGL